MEEDRLDRLPFLRVTLIGAMAAGKTALATSFVNGTMPQRHIKTDRQAVFHCKALVTEETAQGDRQRPIFCEIEDTPASERGPDDVDVPTNDADLAPKIKKGARVVVDSSEQKATALFKLEKYKGRLQWRPAMRAMLGREYTVKEKKKSGAVGLPSADGSEGGVWLWPEECVRLKVALDLPIDRFLSTKPIWRPEAKSQKEKEQEMNALKRPFAAFKRKPDGTDADRTFTRNRMGFMIVFDLADETADSFKEAMNLFEMLQKAIHKHQHAEALTPVVFLVGTKADRTAEYEAMRLNRRSANSWSKEKMIQYHEVSAKTMKGVKDVFHEMMLQILVKEPLWAYQTDDGLDGEGSTENGCMPF